MFEELPTLGIGASLSLTEKPDPISLVQQSGGPQFIEYAGRVDINQVQMEVQRIRHADIPVLFHPSYINFCGSYSNSKVWLHATMEHVMEVESPWLAQDCAYCFWQEGFGYSSQFGYFIPPILNRASLELAIKRVKEVQALSPVPIAIEPPPVSFVMGTMGVFEFFGQLTEATDCALLLDMGHLLSYQLATGLDIASQLDELPGERVIELHIAGGKLRQTGQRAIYIDAHEQEILDSVWDMLMLFLPLLPNVKALCYECEGVEETRVLRVLQRLREAVHQHSASDTLVNSL